MRHGQSHDNARGFISGAGSDPDLTELGEDQARLAATIYNALNPSPTHIVVSSLKRTHQTAALVTGHSNFIIDADINERHLGEQDGLITELRQKELKTLPGEETSNDHAIRVILAVNRHLESLPLPLFICHGGTIRRLLEETDLTSAVTVGNAEIYKLAPSGSKWTIVRS